MSIKKFREPKGETIHDDLNSANEVVGRYFFVQRAGERSALKYYKPAPGVTTIDGFTAPDPTRWMLLSMAG